eukprot:1217206-Alexandrium_andersonii.AAC.1
MGVRGSTTYDISVSSSDSVVPEGCVSSKRLSGVFHTPWSVRYVFGVLGAELPSPPMRKFCGLVLSALGRGGCASL